MRDSIGFVFCRHYTKAAESRFHIFTLTLPFRYVFSVMVGMARWAVPARVAAGGTNVRADTGLRRNCAAARGADIAARCPYPLPKGEGIQRAATGHPDDSIVRSVCVRRTNP